MGWFRDAFNSVAEVVVDIFEIIKEGVIRLGKAVIRLVMKVIYFIKNIVSWFKNPDRLRKIKEDKNTLAVVIKQKMENGEYETINCLFNEDTNDVEEAEIISSEQLGKETAKNFKDKDMMILS
jgi:hypothetical protein